VEISYDRFNAETTRDIPRNLDTYSVPISLRYFSPTGLFANLGATFVAQNSDRRHGSAFMDGHTDFVTVDAGLGYRLPDRRGVISLQATNIFDTHYEYQDDGFREFRDNPTAGPYLPKRLLSLRGVLHL